jgi:hypothetical protein
MKNFTVLMVAGGLLAGTSLLAAQATQNSDQPPRFESTIVVTATPKLDSVVKGSASEYFLNFNAPVGIPGVTLAPGTYLFRFPVPHTGAIQVLKPDRSNVYAMFMSIPVRDVKRDLTSDAQVVMWNERQAGAPPTIKEWYLPGQAKGYEFVYNKK